MRSMILLDAAVGILVGASLGACLGVMLARRQQLRLPAQLQNAESFDHVIVGGMAACSLLGGLVGALVGYLCS